MKKFLKLCTVALALTIVVVSCDEAPFDVADGGRLGVNVNPPRTEFFFYQETSAVSFDIDIFDNGNGFTNVTMTKILVTASGSSDPVTIDVTSGSFSQSLVELFADVPVGGNVLTEDDLLPGDGWEMTYTMTEADGNVLVSPVTTSVPFSCPLNADFEGMYAIEDVTLSAVGGGITAFGPGPVEITATGTFERSFEVVYLPTLGIGNTARTLSFDLECSIVKFGADQPSGLQCVSGIDFGPSVNPSSFDAADDSSFELTFQEDSTEDCGTPSDVTIRFVKQ